MLFLKMVSQSASRLTCYAGTFIIPLGLCSLGYSGACVLLFEGPNCSGTASGAIGQNNPQEPVDSFWATHTNTLKLYRTVDGHCWVKTQEQLGWQYS